MHSPKIRPLRADEPWRETTPRSSSEAAPTTPPSGRTASPHSKFRWHSDSKKASPPKLVRVAPAAAAIDVARACKSDLLPALCSSDSSTAGSELSVVSSMAPCGSMANAGSLAAVLSIASEDAAHAMADESSTDGPRQWVPTGAETGGASAFALDTLSAPWAGAPQQLGSHRQYRKSASMSGVGQLLLEDCESPRDGDTVERSRGLSKTPSAPGRQDSVLEPVKSFLRTVSKSLSSKTAEGRSEKPAEFEPILPLTSLPAATDEPGNPRIVSFDTGTPRLDEDQRRRDSTAGVSPSLELQVLEEQQSYNSLSVEHLVLASQLSRSRLYFELFWRTCIILLPGMAISTVTQFYVPLSPPDGRIGTDDLGFMLVAGPMTLFQHLLFVVPMLRRVSPMLSFTQFKFYVPLILYGLFYCGWLWASPGLFMMPISLIVPASTALPMFYSIQYLLPPDIRNRRDFKARYRAQLYWCLLYFGLIFTAFAYVIGFGVTHGTLSGQLLCNFCFAVMCFIFKQGMLRLGQRATRSWTVHAVFIFYCDALQQAFQNLMFMSSIRAETVAVTVAVNLLLQFKTVLGCAEKYHVWKEKIFHALHIPLNNILDEHFYSTRRLGMNELRHVRCHQLLFGTVYSHVFGVSSFFLLSYLMRSSPAALFFPFSDEGLRAVGAAVNQVDLAMMWVCIVAATETSIAFLFVWIIVRRHRLKELPAFMVLVFRREYFYLTGFVFSLMGFMYVAFLYHFQVFAFVFPHTYTFTRPA